MHLLKEMKTSLSRASTDPVNTGIEISPPGPSLYGLRISGFVTGELYGVMDTWELRFVWPLPVFLILEALWQKHQEESHKYLLTLNKNWWGTHSRWNLLWEPPTHFCRLDVNHPSVGGECSPGGCFYLHTWYQLGVPSRDILSYRSLSLDKTKLSPIFSCE